jgi:hypothetical protein
MVIDIGRALGLKAGQMVTSAISCSGLENLTTEKKYPLGGDPEPHIMQGYPVDVQLPITDDSGQLICVSCFYFEGFREKRLC